MGIRQNGKILSAALILFGINTSRLIALEVKPLHAMDIDDSLEAEVFNADSSKLDQIEHKLTAIMQMNPNSSRVHYVMSMLMMRVFIADPTNVTALRQSSELAMQAYALDKSAEYGLAVLLSLLDVTGELEKAHSLFESAKQKEKVLGWRTKLAKSRLELSSADLSEGIQEANEILKQPAAIRKIVAVQLITLLAAKYEGQELFAQLKKLSLQYPCDEFSLATAHAAIELKQKDEALYELDLILKTNPNHRLAMIGKGIVQLELQKNHKKAVATFKQALTLPGSSDSTGRAKQYLAVSLLRAGNSALNEALAAATSAENIESSLEKLLQEYTKTKRWNEAERFLQKLNEERPGLAISYAMRGDILSSKLKRYDEAIEAFGDAIILDDTNSGFFNGRGLASYHKKKYEAALKDFLTAFRINPADASARYNAACALALLQKNSEALELLESALDMDENLVAQAALDQDFKTLRSSSRFQDMINRRSDPAVAH